MNAEKRQTKQPRRVCGSEVMIQTSPAEMHLLVLSSSMLFDDGKAVQVLLPTVDIILSPVTARNLRDILSMTIESYEREFGKIPSAPTREKEKMQ